MYLQCFQNMIYWGLIKPNKKINAFQVTGLENLGRVGTHIFFLEKNLIMFESENFR